MKEFDTINVLLTQAQAMITHDARSAARQFARVLSPGGQIGLSDLTRKGELPLELDTLLAWVACIAAARPVEDYTATLQQAGFTINQIEPHNPALAEMVRSVQGRLLAGAGLVEVMEAIGAGMPGRGGSRATVARVAQPPAPWPGQGQPARGIPSSHARTLRPWHR